MIKLAAVTAAVALPLTLVAIPAHADPKPWHIKNSTYSQHSARIYGGNHCDGGSHVLSPGASAQSYSWDSMKASYRFNVRAYVAEDGRLLSDRTYAAGSCVRAYDNDYLITVFYGASSVAGSAIKYGRGVA